MEYFLLQTIFFNGDYERKYLVQYSSIEHCLTLHFIMHRVRIRDHSVPLGLSNPISINGISSLFTYSLARCDCGWGTNDRSIWWIMWEGIMQIQAKMPKHRGTGIMCQTHMIYKRVIGESRMLTSVVCKLLLLVTRMLWTCQWINGDSMCQYVFVRVCRAVSSSTIININR